LEKFQKVATYTTKTAIQKIIIFSIWNAWIQANILASLRINDREIGFLINQEKKQKRGISRLKEGYGTKDMPKGLKAGLNGSGNLEIAKSAKKSSTASSEKEAISKNFVHLRAELPTIESVETLNYVEDVWCITVPNHQHFSLANGAIVHNCTDAFIYSINAVNKMTGNTGLTPQQWKEIRMRHT